jgi:hypothetical protein
MIVTVNLADMCTFKLILSVPLKFMNRNFVLYKMFTFPLKMMLVELQHEYLANNSLRQQYRLITAKDMTQCRDDKLSICLMNQAVYNKQLIPVN